MPDSPPRRPDISAAAAERSSGEPNRTRHSTSTPAPAASGSIPPSSSGTLPSAPATLTCRTRAPRSGSAAAWSASTARPPAAGAYSPGARGATAIGWRSAAAMSGWQRIPGARWWVFGAFSAPFPHHRPLVSQGRLDSAAHLAQRVAAQHDLVAVLQEGAGRAVRQLDRLVAVPAQLDQASALVAVRPRDRPGGQQVAGPEARAVHRQVRYLLRDRPVEVAGIRLRDDSPVQLDRQCNVVGPRLLREIRERRRL